MGILCGLGKHEPLAGKIWNDGFYFSRCKSCETEIIRRADSWRAVPKGYRVVWKPRTAGDLDWSTRLPCDEREADLAAFLKGSWS